jgi:pimeloyl-ACP methyl ester carboxylesterase
MLDMQATRHLFRQVNGHTVFYREAGHADAPAVVLLHGAPASSHMFRELIPRWPTISEAFLGVCSTTSGGDGQAGG